MIERLLGSWDWEPSIIIGCSALLVAYFRLTRGRWSKQTWYFVGGVILLLLDLVSPLDTLGDNYLLSAHIVQHFFLALIIPPLFLFGIPRSWMEMLLRRRSLAWIEHHIGHPPTSWILGVGTMLIWHVPGLFNAALDNEAIHIIQHLSFLITGTIYWWPILAPIDRSRLPVMNSVAYLFTACVSCSLLGAALTFSPHELYPAYSHPEDSLNILSLVRENWGLNARNDQQLGGLLMWVPGCFVYLSAILGTLARWYGMPEREQKGFSL